MVSVTLLARLCPQPMIGGMSLSPAGQALTSDIDKNSNYYLVEKSNVSQPLNSSRVMEIRGTAKMVFKKSSLFLNFIPGNIG
jgi:hypothetical protein